MVDLYRGRHWSYIKLNCDPMMNIIEKIVAHAKHIAGSILSEKEYYYLMFKCETDDDIALIKSMTLEECKYFLDCCWYLGIEHTTDWQLIFMRNYKKFYHG